jgi:murein DD-endopeptidase MepM/ murein hydrolase activator NlpD
MRYLFLLIIVSTFLIPQAAVADGTKPELQQLFESMETLTGVPWEYLAAFDRYESNIHKEKQKNRLTHIQVPSYLWAGVSNPSPDDASLVSIHYFGGMGLDGDGDGRANVSSDRDVLYTLSRYLISQGPTVSHIRERIWHYYHQPMAVDVITHLAKIYEKFNTIKLEGNAFPIPKGYIYTYRSTWGDRRGWGGLRIHEGTDIFAHYGTPVRSTCFGYIELKGWNRYGGWRLGIRDVNNRYHYFGHLNGFEKGIKKGDIVRPGQVLGYVGSSGYGPPGTSGKFPPHLHYGIYKFNGKKTYSYDPYPLLKKWEREYRK